MPKNPFALQNTLALIEIAFFNKDVLKKHMERRRENNDALLCNNCLQLCSYFVLILIQCSLSMDVDFFQTKWDEIVNNSIKKIFNFSTNN